MKKLIIIFSLAAAVYPFKFVSAQTVVVPADTFPLGIFDISGLDGISLNPGADGTGSQVIFDKMAECGLNTFYSVNQGYVYSGCCESYQTDICKNLRNNSDGSYLGNDGGGLDNKYLGNRFAIYGAEVRDFLLPSNPTLVTGDPIFDYETALFQKKQAGNIGVPSTDPEMTLIDPTGAKTSPPNSEWKFPQGGSDRDILNLRENKNIFATTNTFDANGNVINTGNTGTAYVDFIYRLVPNEKDQLGNGILISNTGTDVLFTITDGTSSLDIHWSDYASGGRDRIYYNEKSSITAFSGQQYYSAPQNLDSF